jgi:SAM-dependent methyltransferase
VRRDERALFDEALHRARVSAYAPGEFVGQESFMLASEILALAVAAGIAPGVSVLDVCCGVAGPGRLVARELGCTYLGVDASPGAIDIARERAGPGFRFEVSRVPPLPAGPFDVVMLLETMLAFRGKEALVRGVSSALTLGGRFAFTIEEGQPLTAAERESMPQADTVWLTPIPDLLLCLERAGFRVRRAWNCSRSHQVAVDSLIKAFDADSSDLRAQLGHRALDQLLAAHRLWNNWLREGRVRKFAIVAEKVEAPAEWSATAVESPRVAGLRFRR